MGSAVADYDNFCDKYIALEKKNAELELKIKHLTEHLEPQSMTSLFEQVEEEVKQEQMIEELKERNGKLAGQKASLERWFGEAKGIIREYVRLANLEKEDTVAIWQLYHKAEQFLTETHPLVKN